MLLKINNTYLPLFQCRIDVKEQETVVYPPAGPKVTFRGAPKAALDLLLVNLNVPNGAKILDLAEFTSEEEPVAPPALTTLLPKLALPPVR